MGVFDSEPSPSPCFGVAHGLGFALPDLVIGHLGVHFGLGGAVEKVPFQIVFADVLLAKPEVVIEHIGGFGSSELAGFFAAVVLANPLRSLGRAGHSTATARVLLFGRRHRHIETKRV